MAESTDRNQRHHGPGTTAPCPTTCASAQIASSSAATRSGRAVPQPSGPRPGARRPSPRLDLDDLQRRAERRMVAWGTIPRWSAYVFMCRGVDRDRRPLPHLVQRHHRRLRLPPTRRRRAPARYAVANAPRGDRSQRPPLVSRTGGHRGDVSIGIGAIVLKGVTHRRGAPWPPARSSRATCPRRMAPPATPPACEVTEKAP